MAGLPFEPFEHFDFNKMSFAFTGFDCFEITFAVRFLNDGAVCSRASSQGPCTAKFSYFQYQFLFASYSIVHCRRVVAATFESDTDTSSVGVARRLRKFACFLKHVTSVQFF